MNNTELNRAIYVILTTQFKKDAKEEHKMVENAGYEIWKNNGEWNIENPATHKSIRVSEIKYRYMSNDYFRFFYHGYNTSILNDKIDFINCLNTPIKLRQYKYYPNKYQD